MAGKFTETAYIGDDGMTIVVGDEVFHRARGSCIQMVAADEMGGKIEFTSV